MPGAFAHMTAVNSAIGMNTFKAHNINNDTIPLIFLITF